LSDLFFKYYTDIAVDGTLLFLVIYIYLKRTLFALLVLPYAVGFLLFSIIIKSFFIHVHRPTFLYGKSLHLVEGVNSQILIHFLLVMNGFIFFALLYFI
jgi:hypothetical protein